MTTRSGRVVICLLFHRTQAKAICIRVSGDTILNYIEIAIKNEP